MNLQPRFMKFATWKKKQDKTDKHDLEDDFNNNDDDSVDEKRLKKKMEVS